MLRRSKFLIIKLLRIRDKAHSVAIGFTGGLLINFVPSFGLGPIISVGVAKLFRGNLVAGFIGGISLIWAFPILFYLNLMTGNLFIPLKEHADVEYQSTIVQMGVYLGKSFLFGMLLNMIIFGILTYLLIYFLISKYRKRLLHYISKSWLPQK